jgi:aspartate 1-decarboxylase
MLREMLKSKIHGAILTESNLNYTGSVTIPADVCRAADVLDGEKVQVVNATTGARLETYVIAGRRRGHYALNGGAARWGHPGDKLLIISYAAMPDEAACRWRPTILILDAKNRIVRRKGPAGKRTKK